MSKEQVIAWAREAGFYVDEKARQNQPNCISHTYHMIDNQLERFAVLVAAAAKADERAACAQVCDGLWQDDGTAYDCREAIRARGETN